MQSVFVSDGVRHEANEAGKSRRRLEPQLEKFDQIVRPIERQMMLTVWHVLGDVHDAEDALQDAMAVIVKHWGRIVRHRNPQALIVKFCADCACDYWRRRSRISQRRGALDNVDAPCREAPAPEELSRRERREQVMSAIARLPRNQASAFLLRIVEEQSYSDIAAALGCSEVTARTHVARARERLSLLLGKLAPTRESTT